jgi:hypothetical protein
MKPKLHRDREESVPSEEISKNFLTQLEANTHLEYLNLLKMHKVLKALRPHKELKENILLKPMVKVVLLCFRVNMMKRLLINSFLKL